MDFIVLKFTLTSQLQNKYTQLLELHKVVGMGKGASNL